MIASLWAPSLLRGWRTLHGVGKADKDQRQISAKDESCRLSIWLFEILGSDLLYKFTEGANKWWFHSALSGEPLGGFL